MESKYPQYTQDDLEKEIDCFCGDQYVQERQKLFQEFRKLSADIATEILFDIRHLQKRSRIIETDSTRKEKYWKEREKLEMQINNLANNPLVRKGINPEAVVFYGPDEVDCPHGRGRKDCEKLGYKVSTWILLDELTRKVNHMMRDMGDPEDADNQARKQNLEVSARFFDQRKATIREEIRSLDPTITSEEPPDLDFCEPFDDESRFAVPCEKPKKPIGRPPLVLRDLFLESVGLLLCRKKEYTPEQAQDLIARILVRCCLDDHPNSEKDLVTLELNLSEALGKAWDKLGLTQKK